ncbi:MAG: cupin-like domain-containing protein [Gammaproteobacteria bacterium]
MGDFSVPDYLKNMVLRSINLWMADCANPITTPLHYDVNDNFYVVVEDRNNFILYPPE